VRSSTEKLIKAMQILSSDIQSDDGVANAAIAEAAQRLEEQQERIKRLEEARTVAAANSLANMLSYEDAITKIKRLEAAGDEIVINYVTSMVAFEIWRKAKEAKL
jgi:hypothetical protein